MEELLDLYPDLDELFDVLDITPYNVVKALLKQGLVTLPPFLDSKDELR